jgi:hypothetical protein
MIPFLIHFSPPHLVCCPGEQTAMVESMRSHAQGAGPISSRGNLHRSCRVLLAELPSLSFSSSLILSFHDVPARSLSLLIWFFAVCLNFTLLTRVHRPTHMLSKARYVISLRPLVRDQLGNQLGRTKAGLPVASVCQSAFVRVRASPPGRKEITAEQVRGRSFALCLTSGVSVLSITLRDPG